MVYVVLSDEEVQGCIACSRRINLMVSTKSLDQYKLVAALLLDVHTSHGVVFNTKSLRNTTGVVKRRLLSEGIGFLTKTLPRLGKAFDKALSGDTPLDASKLGFPTLPNSQLPRFLGELFQSVLHPDGTVLQDPCAKCVGTLRLILYYLYKYETKYSEDQEHAVINRFEKTEDDLRQVSADLCTLQVSVEATMLSRRRRCKASDRETIVREARILLSRVFSGLDLKDITPRHGPGVVATKQQLWEKYEWSNVSDRITKEFPLDAFFYASLGHFCDEVRNVNNITNFDLPAKVILVPKDSRGPRLISCEPVDFQWIQQGVSRRIVEHVESINLTKFNVFFTNQQPNRIGALLGSRSGRYATLDLNEASDRVSVSLVHLLFPSHVFDVLSACRTSSTVLPNGKVLPLQKFAPMGSALCFPILALTVWSILTAAAPDADTRERILVYGDDVIVPTHYALNAMEQLEAFGLKVNRDKSCIRGLFRESCGMDAFQGVCVTPVRIRTVWSSEPSPEALTSWVSYANSFWERGLYHTYDYIVGLLNRVYGSIPSKDLGLTSSPSLYERPEYMVPLKTKPNRNLQRLQYKVWTVKAPVISHEMNGWSMLLRFFVESGASKPSIHHHAAGSWETSSPFSVRSYTRRRSSMLVRRWRTS